MPLSGQCFLRGYHLWRAEHGAHWDLQGGFTQLIEEMDKSIADVPLWEDSLCCDSALISSTGGAKSNMEKGRTIVLKMKKIDVGKIV